jgi:hypothetical protein
MRSLQRSRSHPLCTGIQRFVGLNYRRWKGRQKKNEEAIQTESSALADDIRKKNEEAGTAFVLHESEVGQLSRDLAQGGKRSAATSRKLALLEASLQKTKKDLDGQRRSKNLRWRRPSTREAKGRLGSVWIRSSKLTEVSPLGYQSPSSASSRKESRFQ